MKTFAKAAIIIAVALVVIAVSLIYFSSVDNNPVPVSFTIDNKTYPFVGVETTLQGQERGLMNATVTNSTFMLFSFPQLYPYSFWMKDTYTQLDIIWIYGNESGGRIVYIVNATPCVSYSPNQTDCQVYTPRSPADYVIEAKSGFVQQNNITLSSHVKFNYN